jgi:hypothetical protein
MIAPLTLGSLYNAITPDTTAFSTACSYRLLSPLHFCRSRPLSYVRPRAGPITRYRFVNGWRGAIGTAEETLRLSYQALQRRWWWRG